MECLFIIYHIPSNKQNQNAPKWANVNKTH